MSNKKGSNAFFRSNLHSSSNTVVFALWELKKTFAQYAGGIFINFPIEKLLLILEVLSPAESSLLI